MAWKKYFKPYSATGTLSPIHGGQFTDFGREHVSFRNYKATLPEMYSGHPNRIERYNQYEAMDMDSEINACLDIIAEFSTQMDEVTKLPFDVQYNETPTDNEVKIIKNQLQEWVKFNEFDIRLFKLFRNVIKFGDQIFVRDPETYQLFWIEMCKVTNVTVNESAGKLPEQYTIQDINVNLENLSVAAKNSMDFQTQPTGSGITTPYQFTIPGNTGGQRGRFNHSIKETTIDAEHVIHLSLTEGLDYFWPFGQSILENVYKVFKQKELLEDAILIYRVQRAPERRVFKIDVGGMPTHLAMAFVERVKNEVHQRRIPTNTGGGSNVLDATYNPMSMLEDYFFPTNGEGQGSSVDILQGGQQLGEIDDLKFFNNKLARGLRVPSSYLPTGPDDNQITLSDGRLGTALIQELRFNNYCERLQNLIIAPLNTEFKMFLKKRGFNIDASLFDLKFNPPQNFASYRQADLDATLLSNFSSMADLPYTSKRFLLKRYAGWSEDEIQENEEMWREETGQSEGREPSGSDMRNVGVSPGDFGADLETADMVGAEEGMPEMGGEEMGGEEMGAAAGAPVPPGPAVTPGG